MSRIDESHDLDDFHVSADELALFVIDALSPAVRQRFEEHVAGCAACGRALAAEAAAEETLTALWPEVRRPLAEVVPLPRRPPAPPAVVAPAERPPGGMISQGSFGGLAAAVVAVLFLGWWTDAGRNIAGMASDGPSGALAPLTACLLPGAPLASGEIEDPVCAVGEDGPPLAALASWGMCTGGAPARGCRPHPLPVCLPPEN